MMSRNYPHTNHHNIPTKFETTLEGGYGYSVGSSGHNTSGVSSVTSSNVTRSECECPMCYHSVHNPCSTCGCPSRNNFNSSDNNKHRNVSQGSTSDYSSLSPASPTPDLTSQNSSSRDDNLNSTAESVSQRSTSPGKEPPSERPSSPDKETPPAETETDQHKHEDNDEKLESDSKQCNNDIVCSDNTCDTNNEDNKTEQLPRDTCSWTRDARDKFITNPRRHSWAGGRMTGGVGIPKQTSLQDFKKLLAQKTPSHSSNKTSAVELLSNPAKNESTEPFYSSQLLSGSFRKKVSPRRDHKFAAIEEETESKDDNLLQPEP